MKLVGDVIIVEVHCFKALLKILFLFVSAEIAE